MIHLNKESVVIKASFKGSQYCLFSEECHPVFRSPQLCYLANKVYQANTF